jgi:hypothetical protein
MPNWKKVIVSGSEAALSSLNVTNSVTASIFSGSFTGSLAGTASWANNAISASYALTASFALNGGGGGGGGAQTFTQTTPAVSWSFTHNLGTYTPIVQVYDSSYNTIQPATIVGTSLDITTITFATPTSGYAIISTGGSINISGSNATLIQSTPATTWSFYHGLNETYPVFTIFDNNDDVIVPLRIHAENANTASIYFTTARTGTAVAANCGLSGSTFESASWAATASFVTLAQTASFVTTAQTASYVQNAQTASYVLNAVSSSYATTASYVSSNFQYEVHVSQIDGNDTTGNGDLLNPVASITKALTLIGGSRKTVIIHPGTYTESITVVSTNTTISTSELTGANTLLSGTLTIGTLGSGTRISGLKMTNLVISGTAQAYISNCTVDTQVTKSSSGYVEIINSELQCISGIQISGAGTTIINGNKNVGVAVSNASAQVIIKGCNSVVTPSASAGNLAIVDCIVTALGGNGITITGASTTLTLLNSQVLVQAGNNVAPISVAGIYSIINTIYDKPGSTITGTSTNSVDYFQYIDADNITAKGLTITGSVTATQGFTGSLFGTSSWAQNATTASYILNAVSSSFATTAQTASYVQNAQTASYVLNAVSASYAATASSANSFNIRTSLTASGLNYPTTDGLENQVLKTDGTNDLTFGDVNTMYETVYTGENITKSDPLYISGSQGANPIVYKADAANAAKMPVTYIASETIAAGNTTRGIVLGLIEGIDLTGYAAGTEVFVAAGGGWTDTRPTGSAIVQVLGIVTKGGTGGQGLVLNPGPVELPNLQAGYAWIGDATGVPQAVSTSSLLVSTASFASTATSASYALTSSYLNPVTSGYVVLTQVSQSLNYADDTAAASGGVPLGGLYRNGNFIAIRIV